MNYSKTITTFALAIACLLGSSEAHALTKTQTVVLGGLIGCSYLLFAREPKKDAKPRYSVEKIKDTENIFTKEYLDNLWYFFYDGFIGQPGKKYSDVFGVLGTTAYYLHPLKKASGALAFGYMIYRGGIKLDKHIEKLSKHKD